MMMQVSKSDVEILVVVVVQQCNILIEFALHLSIGWLPERHIIKMTVNFDTEAIVVNATS